MSQHCAKVPQSDRSASGATPLPLTRLSTPSSRLRLQVPDGTNGYHNSIQHDRQARPAWCLCAVTVSSQQAPDPLPEVRTVLPWTIARSRLARAVQTGESPDVIDELRREYRAARLEHQISVVAPELTGAQRARCAAPLLSMSEGGGGHVAA